MLEREGEVYGHGKVSSAYASQLAIKEYFAAAYDKHTTRTYGLQHGLRQLMINTQQERTACNTDCRSL